MVSFNDIPSNLRAPFVTAEFDSSRASQGPAELPYRALLIGQKLKSASAAANSLHRVTNADEVLELCGRGSMLHRMAQAYFNGNTSTETWIGVLDDSSSAALASGTATITGTATADGTISLYVGGRLISVAVTSGDSASTIATNIAAEVGKHASGTVTFASAQAADTVTVGATVFTGASGAVTPGAATFSIDTGNTEAAASLAAQIKAHAVASTKVYASAASGVLTLRAIAGGADGEAVALASSNGTRLAVTGSGYLAGSTDDQDLGVHASSSSGVVTFHARNAGLAANEIDVRVNYQDGEETPAGIEIALVQLSSGTTNPTLTSLISALGDTWYHAVALPYTDATSLSAVEAELSSRFGPLRMIDGVAFAAYDASYATVAALGESRNSKHVSILRTNDSPTPSDECAAHVMGVTAYYAQIDPARPFQTLPLPWIKAPAESDRDTYQERNLLLYDGISTMKPGPGDVMEIERLISTYQENSAGAPDTAYLDLNTLFTLMFLRHTFRARVSTKFPRHKLASDGGRFSAGQAIVTPKLMKAEALGWFRQMESLGLVEGFDQFKTDLVVERNVSNPNRLDILLSPDLMNQLIVSATKIQFLL